MRKLFQYIPPYLPLIPILFYFIGFIALILEFLPVFKSPPWIWDMLGLGIENLIILFISYTFGTIFVIYIIYKWVYERNLHFKYHKEIESDIIKFLDEKIDEKDLDKLRKIIDENHYERDRNIILWIALTIFLFFPIFYILYFLNNDFVKHEIREDKLIHILQKISIESNKKSFTRKRPLFKRNFIVYFILSIITFGLFTIYWAYLVTKDMNKHFREHITWEYAILHFL